MRHPICIICRLTACTSIVFRKLVSGFTIHKSILCSSIWVAGYPNDSEWLLGLLFINESIGGGLLTASGWLITWLLKPLSLLTQFNSSTLDLSNNSQLLLVVGVLVGTILYVRKLRIFLIGTMTVILLMGSTPTSGLRNHEVQMRVFDIGQGLAILVQTRDHAMLFDTGPSFGQFSTGERVLLPALRRHGVTRLDRIIVSHVAADHAGGLEAILLNLAVGDILSGEADRLEGSRR